MAGSDASAERSENVKDFAETESSDIAIHDDTLAHGDEPETIIPDGLRILVKDDIIKKLLEEHVGDERKDVGHGEREMREQLEQPGVVEEHDDTTLMPNSHLSTTGSDEIPESAQPDETARNPPLKAEERLAYSLKSDLTELGHGKD
ncbi:uncharacterized protein A1O5_01977 [Cladophialophora psammophila CBS 110553]|uniref:Uncharacterized protein n=1 Tax=Cladophialophora psammophila CBS 110553 TaxID=1182543 RepID=W9XE94_9EURO|nr:uncharacterized protein A1O5_01977 [Cladophialophora psammophila CBS 110553]EXJ75281.1 hypothetical protein A1O5_01977 [Cladophialophora psammophila CBS 110553]